MNVNIVWNLIQNSSDPFVVTGASGIGLDAYPEPPAALSCYRDQIFKQFFWVSVVNRREANPLICRLVRPRRLRV